MLIGPLFNPVLKIRYIDGAIKSLNDNWSKFLESMPTGGKQFWRITKNIRGKNSRRIDNLQTDTKICYDDQEKANALADNFGLSHQLTGDYKHPVDRKVSAFVKKLSGNVEPNIDASTYTTPGEISSIIKQLRPNKAPGTDAIQNVLIKKLPLKAIFLITKIFNGCLKIGYFPSSFKLAKVLPIPKPSKDPRLPGSYRPISLLSSIGKLFEKIIYQRLNEFVMSHNVIAEEQFGFRQQHSTIHQLRRATNYVNERKLERKSTGFLVLDIEKAFDSCWQAGLLYKLDASNVPVYLLKLIKSWQIANFLFLSMARIHRSGIFRRVFLKAAFCHRFCIPSLFLISRNQLTAKWRFMLMTRVFWLRASKHQL